MKTCFKCGAPKPYSEFCRHPQMADGHLGKCKECAKRDVAERASAVSRHYAWIDRNREHRFATWEDEVSHMESLGYKLVPPEFKIAGWTVQLMAPELAPKLFVSSPSGPREMVANLNRYAGELGYPLYYQPNK